MKIPELDLSEEETKSLLTALDGMQWKLIRDMNRLRDWDWVNRNGYKADIDVLTRVLRKVKAKVR